VTVYEELLMRSQLEQLVTERCGMMAENQQREFVGSSMAYTEEAFQRLSQQLADLEGRIRNAG